jgi:hypothetical protein
MASYKGVQPNSAPSKIVVLKAPDGNGWFTQVSMNIIECVNIIKQHSKALVEKK